MGVKCEGCSRELDDAQGWVKWEDDVWTCPSCSKEEPKTKPVKLRLVGGRMLPEPIRQAILRLNGATMASHDGKCFRLTEEVKIRSREIVEEINKALDGEKKAERSAIVAMLKARIELAQKWQREQRLMGTPQGRQHYEAEEQVTDMLCRLIERGEHEKREGSAT